MDNINKKIKNYTSFELVHKEDTEGKGFYSVKCLRTNEDRDITQISTGEKNIIALLYFIEKLNEINEVETINKLIVFDDPMNSNDDTMQYLIIEELQNLMGELLKNKRNDKIILMTHNVHFYINVKYDFDRRKNDYEKNNNFIRLISDTKKTKIKYIKNKDEDFKTNYESLWHETKILSTLSSCDPAILLNPIRRIVETYTKFNGVDKKVFLSKIEGAKKFFDVNSHSIDDLEADLNGKSKENLTMFKIGAYKTFDLNGLEWNLSGDGFFSQNDMKRRFVVGNNIYENKSDYNAYGFAVKNELGKTFQLGENFTVKPYTALKLGYGSFSKIKEKDRYDNFISIFFIFELSLISFLVRYFILFIKSILSLALILSLILYQKIK